MRGFGGRCKIGMQSVAHNHGYEQNSSNVVQSGHWRNSKRTDCQRDRCTRRLFRPGYRCFHPPIQNAEQIQGACHVEPAGAVRPYLFFIQLEICSGKYSESLYMARCRRRYSNFRQRRSRVGIDYNGGKIPYFKIDYNSRYILERKTVCRKKHD